MTCQSPFAYVIDTDYSIIKYNMGFSGSTTIPGYTTPSYELCVLTLNCNKTTCGPGCICTLGGVVQWCKCCTQDCVIGSGWYWEWTDCSTVPGIPIFPTLNVSASCDLTMAFLVGAGVAFTPAGPTIDGIPAPTPVETAAIEFQNFTFNITVNGVSFTIPVPITLIISETNGSFSATIPLTSITEIYQSGGISYSINFSFNLLACLTPSDGVGWLNIQIVGSFEIEGVIQNFLIVCPIISAEEDDG